MAFSDSGRITRHRVRPKRQNLIQSERNGIIITDKKMEHLARTRDVHRKTIRIISLTEKFCLPRIFSC